MVLRQRSHDLGIVELVEVPIKLADRHEILRGVQADDPVDLGLQLPQDGGGGQAPV